MAAERSPEPGPSSRPAPRPGVDPAEIRRVVATALAEDMGAGDVTGEALIDRGLRYRARVLAKEAGVVSGLDAATAVFETLASDVEVRRRAHDGDRVPAGRTVVLEVEGPAWAVLAGERTALNLLGHLSGIASLTRQFVDAVAGTGATILDTRKTTPGLRVLEKYAVRCGGGTNHRVGLFDGVLIKDNHLRAAGGISSAVRRARQSSSGLPVEVEAETLDEVREALAAGADRILLDNMPLPRLREAVALVGGRCSLEASGGVTLATVRAIAETGVDFISVGALTHSAPSLDVSLEVLS